VILLTKRIISAAERHDVPALKAATSPLHAAIAAVQTVYIVLENGAVWNDLNKADETPAARQQGVGRHMYAGHTYWIIDVHIACQHLHRIGKVGVANRVVADGHE
jgi:hypothetical protein